MSGPPRAPVIVPGEASESDDDDTAPPAVQAVNKLRQPLPKQAVRRAAPIRSVVVSGEATESESEEEAAPPSREHSDITPLQVDETSRGDSVELSDAPLATPPDNVSITSSEKWLQLDPKFDTLLHRKLRETNASLRRSLTGSVGQVYLSSAKEIRTITQHLNKSQLSVQDISHNMRLMTNDLFHLEDKIDIIASCNLLPNINISVSSAMNGTVKSTTSNS